MFMSFFTIIILITNIIFIMMNHPLSLTLLIIMQTIMICLITGPLSYSFWFSYILFLIFLGGMLVLFIYITTLASNELFQLPIKAMIMLMIPVITLLATMINFNQIPSPMNQKIDSINNKLMGISTENSLNQLYNHPNFMLTILSILYLLFTLITVVKITHIHEGPLRQSH